MNGLFSLIVANMLRYVPLKKFRSGQESFYEAIRDAIIAGHRTESVCCALKMACRRLSESITQKALIVFRLALIRMISSTGRHNALCTGFLGFL